MKKYLYKVGIWPFKLYWFLFRPHTYGAKCIIVRDGKILFIRNTYGKHWWNLPGGRIDKGETPEQTAVREAQEEVGLAVEDIQYVGEFLSTLEYKKDHIHVFAGQSHSGSVHIQKEEIQDYEWRALDNLPMPLATVIVRALQMWQNKS